MAVDSDESHGFSWKSSDGHIYKRVLSEGVWSGGQSTPREYSKCQIVATDTRCSGEPTISAYLPLSPSQIEERREWTFVAVIGEATSFIDRLIDRCVRGMYKGETSRFSVNGGSLETTLRLVDVMEGSPPPVYDWGPEEKCRRAVEHKMVARGLVGDGRIEDAVCHYRSAVLLLALARPAQRPVPRLEEEKLASTGSDKSWIVAERDETDAERERLFRTICNNMALCRIKLRQPELALQLCAKVLAREPDNAKCLLRRAEALRMLKEPENAMRALDRVLELEPNNGEAKRAMCQVRTELAQQRGRSIQLAKKMLSLESAV